MLCYCSNFKHVATSTAELIPSLFSYHCHRMAQRLRSAARRLVTTQLESSITNTLPIRRNLVGRMDVGLRKGTNWLLMALYELAELAGRVGRQGRIVTIAFRLHLPIESFVALSPSRSRQADISCSCPSGQ